MNDGLLSQLCERVRSLVPQDRVVTADEAAAWPEGTLASLLDDGVLEQIQPAASVECDACFEAHSELVQFVEEPPGSTPRAYIACPETGRVAVDPERLRRWEIVAGELDQAALKVAQPTGEPGQAFRYSEDYTSLVIDGLEFSLSLRRAAVVRRLHQAYSAGTPNVPWREIKGILSGFESNPGSMRDVFKGEENWRKLVRYDKKGFWRLNL